MGKRFAALAVLLFALILAGGAHAFIVKVPGEIEVIDQSAIKIEVINDSSETKDLLVNFFAAGLASNEVEIKAPIEVQDNSNGIVYVRVSNPSNDSRRVSARLEVHLGNDVVKRDIILIFPEKAVGENGTFTGFFGLWGGGFLNAIATLLATIFIILLLVAIAIKVAE
ncbi:MAG: hypothetical protein NTZ73_03155 [Candidatus Diapherotrites archaeon]|nr:hypothetical protein [Candidatus Diapherotrites archaeon]